VPEVDRVVFEFRHSRDLGKEKQKAVQQARICHQRTSVDSAGSPGSGSTAASDQSDANVSRSTIASGWPEAAR
jgi:hypothetical protein